MALKAKAQAESDLQTIEIKPFSSILENNLKNSRDVQYSAGTQEFATIAVDNAGAVTEKVELHFQAKVGGDIANKILVQAYGQLEDPYFPGQYASFTCNTEFYTDEASAPWKEVRSFYGPASLETRENGGQYWDSVASDDELPEGTGIWTTVAGDDEVNYKSEDYAGDDRWQTCTAGAVLYQATDGVAPDPAARARNASYLYAMKEGVEFKI